MKQLEMKEIPGPVYQNDGDDQSGVYEDYNSVRYANDCFVRYNEQDARALEERRQSKIDLKKITDLTLKLCRFDL